MIRARIGLIALGALQPGLAAAQRSYSLFRPTPWAEARALNTDRPDKTESPFTVPAGRVQLEFDLVNYTRDVTGTGSQRTRCETPGHRTRQPEGGSPPQRRPAIGSRHLSQEPPAATDRSSDLDIEAMSPAGITLLSPAQ